MDLSLAQDLCWKDKTCLRMVTSNSSHKNLRIFFFPVKYSPTSQDLQIVLVILSDMAKLLSFLFLKKQSKYRIGVVLHITVSTTQRCITSLSKGKSDGI